jgi:periplasmic divalent cation tolerance protein
MRGSPPHRSVPAAGATIGHPDAGPDRVPGAPPAQETTTPSPVPRRRPAATRVLLSTAPPSAAARLARALVRERLAACVNLVPGVESTYRWRGRVETARETLLLVKTSARTARACLARLRSLHPYELPEGLLLTPSGGFPDARAWVDAETTQPKPAKRVRRGLKAR